MKLLVARLTAYLAEQWAGTPVRRCYRTNECERSAASHCALNVGFLMAIILEIVFRQEFRSELATARNEEEKNRISVSFHP